MTKIIDHEFASMLAARYGSPLYAYDLDAIMRRAGEIAEILPDRARLFYSLKANPLPEIGAALKESCGAEVSSPGELAAAVEAGYDREWILYTGPGKTDHAIQDAIRAGVQHFSCESWRDAERLARIARSYGVRPRVLLRINPSLAPRAQLSMSRGAGQFGIAEETLTVPPDEWSGLVDALEILGVHVYLGTQLHHVAALEAGFRAAVDTAERIAGRLSLDLRVVDAGGGFPWPFATAGSAPDLGELRQSLVEICSAANGTANTEYWFESGRYICASAGTLLATVVDDKVGSGGRRYVVLDAGINALGGMAGLGRVLTSAMSVIPIGPTVPGPWTPADVVGPLCTPLDILARDVSLPALPVDSLVAIPNVGAYGLTASLVAFLSQPAPVEVMYRGVEVSAARRLRLTRERIA
jgi:diaminopimelate decarboxylase